MKKARAKANVSALSGSTREVHNNEDGAGVEEYRVTLRGRQITLIFLHSLSRRCLLTAIYPLRRECCGQRGEWHRERGVFIKLRKISRTSFIEFALCFMFAN